MQVREPPVREPQGRGPAVRWLPVVAGSVAAASVFAGPVAAGSVFAGRVAAGRVPVEPTRRAALDRESGVATVFACVLVVVLLLLAGLGVQFGAVQLARHRAEVAADLAALAGAARALTGRDAACAFAGGVAASNGASVRSCEMVGLDLRVTVVVRVRAGPVQGGAMGRARAGPIGAPVG